MQAEPWGADRPELVSRWHQRLAVALDGPLENLDPGAERLFAVITAYLDTQRATAVRPDPGPLFRSLLVQDLGALGAVDPARAADDLLRELDAVAVLEDAAGRELASARATLLRAEPPGERRAWLRRGPVPCDLFTRRRALLNQQT